MARDGVPAGMRVNCIVPERSVASLAPAPVQDVEQEHEVTPAHRGKRTAEWWEQDRFFLRVRSGRAHPTSICPSLASRAAKLVEHELLGTLGEGRRRPPLRP